MDPITIATVISIAAAALQAAYWAIRLRRLCRTKASKG